MIFFCVIDLYVRKVNQQHFFVPRISTIYLQRQDKKHQNVSMADRFVEKHVVEKDLCAQIELGLLNVKVKYY